MEVEKKFATLGNYQLVKLLGQGYNAKVKLGLSLVDGKYYAVKIFKKTHAFEKNKDSLTKEYQVM
jgi:serine/threonine protein kinase